MVITKYLSACAYRVVSILLYLMVSVPNVGECGGIADTRASRTQASGKWFSAIYSV